MATTKIKFRKVTVRNYFPYTVLKNLESTKGRMSLEYLARWFALKAAENARRSMQKGPKPRKSLTRFGQWKKRKSGKKYFQKGQYSPPGKPPFYHPDNKPHGGNLRKYIRAKSSKRAKYGWLVGPKIFPQKAKPPVPDLHEFGGIRRTSTSHYKDRIGKTNRRSISLNGRHAARFPPRPYMRPAIQKTLKEPRFIKLLGGLGGMSAKHVRSA